MDAKQYEDEMQQIEVDKNKLDLDRQKADFEAHTEDQAFIRKQQELDMVVSKQEIIRRNIEVLLSIHRADKNIHHSEVKEKLGELIKALQVPA